MPHCILRRARGFAPRPQIVTAPDSPAVLAVGAELKSAVCLLRNGRAVLSEHVGDLKDGRVFRHFVGVISDLESLFEVAPAAIAADLHPGYLSSDYAVRRSRGQLPGRPAVPLVRVQHHHAHIVSCLAEHNFTGDCLGLACDGVGYGDDGAVWGCEVLRASPADYVRLGHLRYFALPGGDAAATATARPALSLLLETFGPGCVGMDVVRRLFDDVTVAETLVQSVQAGVNAPPTSSLGRLFDAASAMVLSVGANQYEGQAPMLLEGAIRPGVEESYPFALVGGDSRLPIADCRRVRRSFSEARLPSFLIDYRPMVEAMVRDLAGSADPGVMAARFHNTVAEMLLASARRAREMTGLETVALSGGCFANRYLRIRLHGLLSRDRFTVLVHRNVPCNDGGIALGQAVCAAWRLAEKPQ